MARVKDCGQSHTRLQRLYQDSVHLIVDNVSDLAEINWVDAVVVLVFLVSIEILSLTTVPWGKLGLPIVL
jgi:hypothetical protein